MAIRSIGICTAVAALAADQASKAFVLANAETLAPGVAVFPGFNLIFHRNYGVTFGFFQNVPWWVLALVATAVVLFLVVSLIRATQAAEWPASWLSFSERRIGLRSTSRMSSWSAAWGFC